MPVKLNASSVLGLICVGRQEGLIFRVKYWSGFVTGGPNSSKHQYHDTIIPTSNCRVRDDQLICSICATFNGAVKRYQPK